MPPYSQARTSGNEVNMNRRVFLASAGATCLASTLPLRAQSSGPDPNLINLAIASHASSCANSWSGVDSVTQWNNLAGIHSSMLSDCLSKNLDAPFMDAIRNLSASQINPGVINQQQAASEVQAYQPAFPTSTIQQYYTLTLQAGAISSSLTGLQTQGLSAFLRTVIARSQRMAFYASQETAANVQSAHLVRAGYVTPHPTKPPCKPGQKCDPGGSGGYSCPVDGMLSFGLSSTFLIIGFLAAPEIGILTAPFWGSVGLWGSVGAGAWTAGHVIHCNF